MIGHKPLRVAVDYRPVEKHSSGIARYVSELVQRIESYPDLTLWLLSSDPLRPVRRVRPEDRFAEPYLPARIPFPFKKIVRKAHTEPRFAAVFDRVDIVWGTSYVLPTLKKISCKQIVTVHDMAAVYYPETIPEKMLQTLSDLPYHLDAADAVFVVSEATKVDVVKHFGTDAKKIRVIYNGVSDRFRRLDGSLEVARNRYRLPKRFFLFVGTVEPRKNLVRLIQAFNRVGKELDQDLVIVGAKGWMASPLFDEINRSPFRDRIHLTGFVEEVDLPAVYNLADALIYPSLYEGFGIPVVEAMACGTPVVTSNVSALPETANDAAVLVDPLDTDRLAHAMERIVHDEELRASLRAKGLVRARRFSWDASARDVVRCFRDLICA